MPKKSRPEFYYEPDRDMWCKQALLADGKYHKIRASTQRELREKIRAVTEAVEVVVAAEKYARENITVKALCELWLPIAVSGIRYNSVSAIKNAVDNHIVPVLGDMYAREVMPGDIDRLMLSLDGRSSSLRQKVLLSAKRVFTYAVKNKYADSNPCDEKKPGGKKAEEKKALTDEQAALLLSALNTERTHRTYLFCMLGLYTGMRREEILGLAWESVFLDAAIPLIKVEATVTFEGNKGVRSNLMKSDAASRILPIPPELLLVLKLERAAHPDSVFLFFLADGRVYSRQAMRKLWELVTNRQTKKEKAEDVRHPFCPRIIDFDVTPHTLRHTYITNLCIHSAETGLDIKSIQVLAGHSDPSVTLKIYTHAMQSRRMSEISEKVVQTFQPQIQPQAAI